MWRGVGYRSRWPCSLAMAVPRSCDGSACRDDRLDRVDRLGFLLRDHRGAEQVVELGMEVGVTRDPVLRPEPQAPSADGRDELDHDVALARELRPDILELAEHAR